jgi:DNA transposition AAA+ family ATPase
MFGGFAMETDLREHILELIRGDATLTQKRVAKESGCSEAALNQWLNCKPSYETHPPTVEKLTKWLDSRARRSDANSALPPTPGYVSTPSSDMIMSVLTYAQMAADLAVIYGGPGVGKTRTISRYQETNPNVWVATMSPDCSTVSATLEEITEAFGLHGSGNFASSRMRRALCRKMRGTGGLLVIDEAQHLRNDGIEEIRSIHDATEIGVVLVGNESVYSRLTGGHRAAHFSQLFSRVGKKLRLNRPVKGDVIALAEALNVTGNVERDLLLDIAQKPGALRGVVKTVRLAGMFAAGAGVAVTEEHIRSAWRDLGGEV